MKARNLVVSRWSKEQSSNVAVIKYFPRKQHLDITFHNGSTYRYLDVPRSIYDNAKHAQSVGAYVSQSVKNSYQFEKQ